MQTDNQQQNETQPYPSYPGVPPPAPKKRTRGKFFAIGCGSLVLLGVIIAIIAIATSAGSKSSGSTATSNTNTGAAQSANMQATNEAQATQNVAQTQPTPPPSASHYAVGQTVSTADGFDITVNSVSDATNSGNEFETPPPGDQWIVIDVSVKNMSGSVQQVNPLDFTLIDSTGQHMTWTILSSLPNTHTFDLTALQPGATNRGVLAYEVPTGKHAYQLAFAIDQFSGNQTLWDISA